MKMLNDVKDALRENGNYSDIEIQDLIDAAKADLAISGVKANKFIVVKKEITPAPSEEDPNPEKMEVEIEVVDPLIKRAIIAYCKANFGYDDPKLSERFQEAYVSLKHHLALSAEYSEVVIT